MTERIHKIILLGAPGAGKGTQAMLMSQHYNLPQISTGDILRNEIEKGSSVGLKARDLMVQGLLVPDGIVVEIVEKRLEAQDCRNGYILDGFPRTLTQAQEMDSRNIQVNSVLLIDAEDTVIMRRLSGRRVCTLCNRMYHVLLNPPKDEGICTECGGQLIKRKDDEAQTIQKRINVFRKQTAPLIDYYASHRNVVFSRIDGGVRDDETPIVIFERIKVVLDGEDL
ncbi:adenylate kinase [bacterium]|nr:adenylate kinase [bacterium]